MTGPPSFLVFKKSECTTKQSSIVICQMFGKLMLPKNLHGLGLSNVKKSGRFFFKFCGLLTIYELYVTVLRPRVTRMKCIERSINLYIPMTMLVLLNKVIQWHCIQKIENESPLFQPQTEDSLLHSTQSPYITHGPLPWTVLFEKNYENLQNWIFFENPFIKDIKVYKSTDTKKGLKFALYVELAQLKFTYITVVM